ncbi:MAG: chemotaxis protein [Rhizobiales bacterium 32-66-11]|nr:MAG: chemotaxis protein [Rhizobiales bacterium 32-66-11]
MFSGKEKAKLAAVSRSQAVIEFDRDGNVLSANEGFLKLMGYTEAEIVGVHHRIFVLPEERDSPDYAAFWQNLRAGQFQAREFLRVAKDGREVWIQASYNPILDGHGRTQSIMKIATDITAQKAVMAELNSILNAIHRVQAVIEFDLEGNILVANENFLSALGYRLGDVRGRHHSMFVTPEERESPAYRQFWDALRRGEYFAGEFCRRGKDNKEVWIQASYNPVFDSRGKVYKVIKFASDVTAQALERQRRERRRQIDEELREIAEAITATSHQAVGAVAASTQASASVGTIAAAVEELSSSIDEITQQASRSVSIAHEAAVEAQRTNSVVAGLAEAAQKIGAVVELISQIAGQTNLLALNATIEAARAGDMGKGFAVVATEVKTLAAQTSRATGEISAQIAAVRESTEGAVAAINQITTTISRINDVSTSIAGAVSEQAAVTSEISRNMHGAATGVNEIVERLATISASTQQIDAANRKVQDAQRAAA